MATALCADCGQVSGKFSWFEANGAVSLLCPPCHNYSIWAYQDKLEAEAAEEDAFADECERLAAQADFVDPGEQEDDFIAEEDEEEEPYDEDEEPLDSW